MLDAAAVKASEIPTYAIIQCIHGSSVFGILLSGVLVRVHNWSYSFTDRSTNVKMFQMQMSNTANRTGLRY